MKAFLALKRFRTDAPFRPWLLKIVGNEARNRRKSVARFEHLKLREASRSIASAEVGPSPELSAIAEERKAELLESLESLGEKHRAVIFCRFLLDLSEEETARLLGWPKGTVKSRTSRALSGLRERLVQEK